MSCKKENSPDYIWGPCHHASTNRIPEPASMVEANMGTTPDSDRISAMNTEVESSMNHRCRWAALRDPNISEEAFNFFNSGDAYIRVAQDGLARATNQYLKDIRVREFNKYV